MKFARKAVPALAATCPLSPARAQALPGDFVYLRDIDPTIIQDIRYATSNNFAGRRLAGYGAAECVVKREVGIHLKAVQRELARQNLSLKMLDCYRPARAVADMVAWAHNGKETAASTATTRPFPRPIFSALAISPRIPAIPRGQRWT